MTLRKKKVGEKMTRYHLEDGTSLDFNVCLSLLRNDINNFYRISPKDDALYLETIKLNPLMIREKYQPSSELVFEALKGSLLSLKYIRVLNEEQMKIALQRDSGVLEEIKEVPQSVLDWLNQIREIKRILRVEKPKGYHAWDDEMWKKKLNENGLYLKFLSPSNQTKELCAIALKENVDAFVFVSLRNYRMCRYAIHKKPIYQIFSMYHLDFELNEQGLKNKIEPKEKIC